MVKESSPRKSEILNSAAIYNAPLEYAFGRPPKYDPSWMLQKTIDLMSQGATKIEICACFGICRDTFYDWMDKHKEFSEAVKIGSIMQQSWWEREGRLNISNNKFNSPLWSKMISAMFRDDWSDKKEKEQVDIQSILNALNLEALADEEVATLTRILRDCVIEKKND